MCFQHTDPLSNASLRQPNSLGVRGVIFTTCDKSCPLPHPNVLPGQFDFISRYFAPWNGIPEDPVTGRIALHSADVF